MQLHCFDEGRKPVHALISFYSRQNKGVPFKDATTKRDGSVEIPRDEQGFSAAVAVIRPLDGHWSLVTRLTSQEEQVLTVRSITRPHDMNWWREILGRTSFDDSAGQGMKIGVIDIGFEPASTLGHVICVDIEGMPFRPHRSDQRFGHGHRVCKIIAERGSMLDRQGIAPAAEVVIVDVQDEFIDGYWDSGNFAAAIQLLVDEYKVDAINVSGGITLSQSAEEREDDTKFFKNAIDYATSSGVAVIAAAGNVPNAEVALPAKLDGVIAVGAIGKYGLAPEGTLLDFYGQKAEEVDRCVCHRDGRPWLFHHVESSYGNGLDVVAPGVGVVLAFDDEFVHEYDGTSYAAPMVTGILACAGAAEKMRAQDEDWKGMRLRHICEAMAVDLGMDPFRQGIGLPMLSEGATW